MQMPSEAFASFQEVMIMPEPEGSRGGDGEWEGSGIVLKAPDQVVMGKWNNGRKAPPRT